MKLGIDYREAIKQNKAGKGVVLFELIEEFKNVVPGDWQIDLLVDEDFDMTGFPDNFQKKIIKWPGLWWHLRATWEVWWKYDVYLALTSFMVPRLSMSKKCVVMVHDLIAFIEEYSTHHNKSALWNERLTAGGAFKTAGKIIVPSRSTKNDLLKMFKVNEDKIELILEGVNKLPVKVDLTNVKKKYGITGEYLFFVSTIEPRKNIVRLIEAFSKLRSENGWNGQLVLAGKKGWYYEEVFAKIQDLNLDNDVIFAGRISDEEKFALIGGAKCLCYPSLYEGFGLPVLEGMVMGVPVVTSNISSLPEVAGDAAIMVDPKNVDEIKEGMARVVSDEKLAKDLADKGCRQVKKFSWKKAANRLFQVITDIM